MGAARLVEALVMRRMGLLVLLAACGDRPAAAPKVEESALSRPAPDAAALVMADTVTVDLPLALPAQLYVEHDAAIYARSPGIIEEITVASGGIAVRGRTCSRFAAKLARITIAFARESLSWCSSSRGV